MRDVAARANVLVQDFNFCLNCRLQGEDDDGEYDEDADPDFVPQV